jgi:WD40 repeat protein
MSGQAEDPQDPPSEQRQYALNAAMYHLISARMWDELAQLFAAPDFIAERAAQSGFADVYYDALAAARASGKSSQWKEALGAWEYFLRRRIERLGSVPGAYPQEVVNEFLPTAPAILAARLGRLRDHPHEAPGPYLRKISGPPALGEVQTGVVYGMTFSPDQRLAMCGTDERTVKIWNVQSGELQAECVGHTDCVRCVAFSSDGRLAASGGHDRTVKVWDAASGRLIATCGGHEGWVGSVAFSADGRWVASADRSVRVWEAETGRPVAAMAGHDQPVSGLGFSADGRLLASAGGDAKVRVWETAAGRLAAECAGHRGSVGCVCFFADGTRLASGGDDGTVKVWRAESGELLMDGVAGGEAVTSIAVSPGDGLLAAAVGAAPVTVWSPAAGQLVNEYRGHEEKILAVSFAADGMLAAQSVAALYTAPSPAASLGETAGDRVIRVWDRESARLLAQCALPGQALGLLLSADGRSLVSYTDDRTVSVWDLPSGRLTGACRGLAAQVTCAAASPDGTLVAAGGADGAVLAWAASGRLTGECRGLGAPATCVAVSADASRVAAGGAAGQVVIWDAADGREICRCAGHSATVTGLAFAPDGETIASGSEDATVAEWRADTGELVTGWRHENIGPVRSVEFGPEGIEAVCPKNEPSAFASYSVTLEGDRHSLNATTRMMSPPGHAVTSADGTLLAASDRLLATWAGRRPVRLAVGADLADGIRAVAISPDGRRIAWGRSEVSVLDQAAGHELAVCAGHRDGVGALAFAPDGRTLASVGGDHLADTQYTVRLWDTDTGSRLTELPMPGDDRPVALAFSPDGGLLVVGNPRGEVRVWDVAAARPLFEDTETMEYVSDVAFAPNGRFVMASGSSVKAWNVETGEVADLPGGGGSALQSRALLIGFFWIATSFVDLGPLRAAAADAER